MTCPPVVTPNPLCIADAMIGGGQDLANAAATSAFSGIADTFAAAAQKASTWLWQEIDTATSLDLSSAGVQRELAMSGAIAVVACLILFVIQLIKGALWREPGAVGRAVTGLLTAMLGAGLAIGATRVSLVAIDELSNGIVQATMRTNMQGLGTQFAAVQTSSQQNAAVTLLTAVVVVAACVIVWAAMMLRKLMIIVAAVLAPIAFAGAAADLSRAWVRRWVEFAAAMVASKLLLVIILSIGLSILEGAGMDGSRPEQTTTQVIGGSLVLLMGGFAPWIAIRLVTFAGESLHAAHVTAASTTAGGRAVIAAPQKVQAIGYRVGALNARSPGLPSAGGGALSPSSPGRPGAGVYATTAPNAQNCSGSNGQVPGGGGGTGPTITPGGPAAQPPSPHAGQTPAPVREQAGPARRHHRAPPDLGASPMTDTPAANSATYRFPRLPKRGLLMGLSALRVAALAAALAVLVPAIFVAGPAGGLLTAPLWGALTVGAFVRRGGQPVVDWVPTIGHFGWRRATGHSRGKHAGEPLRNAGAALGAPPGRDPGPGRDGRDRLGERATRTRLFPAPPSALVPHQVHRRLPVRDVPRSVISATPRCGRRTAPA